jgi:hypothetical protein
MQGLGIGRQSVKPTLCISVNISEVFFNTGTLWGLHRFPLAKKLLCTYSPRHRGEIIYKQYSLYKQLEEKATKSWGRLSTFSHLRKLSNNARNSLLAKL